MLKKIYQSKICFIKKYSNKKILDRVELYRLIYQIYYRNKFNDFLNKFILYQNIKKKSKKEAPACVP